MNSEGPSPETKHPIPGVLRERLQKVQWWDWDPAKVTRNVKALCSLDVDTLERAV